MSLKDVFQSGCEFLSETDKSVGRCSLSNAVPAGKSLVLETVTGYYYGDSGATLGAAFLTIAGVRHAFPWVQCGSRTSSLEDRRFYGFNHYVRLYIDGPATLQFDAAGAAGGTSYSGGYSVSGYLQDIPPQ